MNGSSIGSGLSLEADRVAAVLVVEDEPVIRAMSVATLRNAGYRVFEACNAADAIVALQAGNGIGAVFTDVQMPGDMNGLTLAAAIGERWPAIAVLVTSGQALPCERSLPAGVDFLPKPYRQLEMIRRIGAAMDSGCPG